MQCPRARYQRCGACSTCGLFDFRGKSALQLTFGWHPGFEWGWNTPPVSPMRVTSMGKAVAMKSSISTGSIKAGFSRDGSSAAGAMQRSWSYFCSTAPGRLADNRCKNSACKVQTSGTPMVQNMNAMGFISGPENLSRRWPRFRGRLYEFQ